MNMITFRYILDITNMVWFIIHIFTWLIKKLGTKENTVYTDIIGTYAVCYGRVVNSSQMCWLIRSRLTPCLLTL